jgi:hypothetical protein
MTVELIAGLAGILSVVFAAFAEDVGNATATQVKKETTTVVYVITVPDT